MSPHELFARLTDELPDIEPAVPAVFVEDDLLPSSMALVEPGAFLLECAATAYGPHGPRN